MYQLLFRYFYVILLTTNTGKFGQSFPKYSYVFFVFDFIGNKSFTHLFIYSDMFCTIYYTFKTMKQILINPNKSKSVQIPLHL